MPCWRISRGAVLVSVPYFPTANTLSTLVPLVDRTVYPIDQFPDGQWDYYRYYNNHFVSAVADLDADKAASLASIYRRGDPAVMGKPAENAKVTSKGGRFGAAHRAPPTAPDPALWPSDDFAALVRAFEANGFRGPCSWYLNDEANDAYMRRAPDVGRISQPILSINGALDQMNSIVGNRYGDPMRAACSNLTVTDLGTTKGPGWYWLIPFVDRVVRVDQRTKTVQLETQETITRDGVAVRVNAVLWFRAVDPARVVTVVENWQAAVI